MLQAIHQSEVVVGLEGLGDLAVELVGSLAVGPIVQVQAVGQ
jgi:hypothetical protein